jgi:hypothetical protein
MFFVVLVRFTSVCWLGYAFQEYNVGETTRRGIATSSKFQQISIAQIKRNQVSFNSISDHRFSVKRP